MASQLPPLRIVVADDEHDMREFYVKLLHSLGHSVVASASNGRELVEHCQNHKPDLIITDVKMEELSGLQAVNRVCNQQYVPVIIVSAYYEPHLLDAALTHPVLAYLIKPINSVDLEITLAISARRFGELQELRTEAESLRQALEDRKIIEKAKGVLMRMSQLDEQEAFKRLQKLARDKNVKLVDVARTTLQTAELLTPQSKVNRGKIVPAF